MKDFTCFAEEDTYPERVSLLVELASKSAFPEDSAELLRLSLVCAAQAGDRGLVDELIEAGASGKAGWKGPGGRTLLNAAARGGDEGVFDLLIEAGDQPDVNVLYRLLRVCRRCGWQ